MKKIDLHTHTIPTISDYDFQYDQSKVIDYVEKLGIDALAITNHNLFELKQYYELKNLLHIPVFPGIEINLEGGHILVIADTDEFEVSQFEEKCKRVSALIKTSNDDLTLSQFTDIFNELNRYILIPHYDKKPNIKKDIIEKLHPHVTAGEVASISKFKRVAKEELGLVPVLFSDIRFQYDISDFPTRQTYVDLKDVSFAGIKSCLNDKSKISLSSDGGNDFFQATDDGLILSTGLNIIIGERSSGKTVTLDKISSSSGNCKYIKQFSLLQNDEERFNEFNRARQSLVYNNYLAEFRDVVSDIVNVDLKRNSVLIDQYLDSLKKFASDSEKQDLYAKCALFNEDPYSLSDLSNLDKLITSVITLVENKEYEEIIARHVSLVSLKNLARDLMLESIRLNTEKNQMSWINSLINEVKRELRIKTTVTYVEDIDVYKIALDELKVDKFNAIASSLKQPKEIDREVLGKFSVKTSISQIDGAADLVKIGRDKKTYSTAFAHYDIPYAYLLKLKELGVEDANTYRFFIKVDSSTYNSDGFRVSGGERSEFNLIHEIQDATKYDLLLIDEPESSFDNLFLKKEINSLIKNISSLMPVVVVTHNNTVGASIKPNYIALTQKSVEHGKIVYRLYSGYPSDKELVCPDGKRIKNLDAMLNCLEAGESAYIERKDQTYEILKD